MNQHVLILGNPVLRERSEPVTDFGSKETAKIIEDLKNELELFRKRNGFGRGIAAIQVGIKRRVIALNLGQGPFCILNPEITFRSEEVFRMWDDCMSFPDLVVRVLRHTTINIKYTDEDGNIQEWKEISQDISELLQHEIDHLDGILATDRAIERGDIIYKCEYMKNKEQYDSLVDYFIQAT